MARYLKQQGVLEAINERVRFARRRFGRYEVIDFLVVLFGYAISGERMLEAFYQRLQPFADPFMALFGRDRQPVRSTLSRFLAALTSEPVDTLRSLFLDDLLSRPLSKEKQPGGLADRAGNTWVVFAIDGTREAARQRALPQTEALPPVLATWVICSQNRHLQHDLTSLFLAEKREMRVQSTKFALPSCSDNPPIFKKEKFILCLVSSSPSNNW